MFYLLFELGWRKLSPPLSSSWNASLSSSSISLRKEMRFNYKNIKWIIPTYQEPPPPSASKPPPLPILPPFSIRRRRIGVCTDLSETSQSQVSVNNLQFFMKRILYHSCLHLSYLSSQWDNSLKIGLKTHKTKNTGHMSRSKWSLGGEGEGGQQMQKTVSPVLQTFWKTHRL